MSPLRSRGAQGWAWLCSGIVLFLLWAPLLWLHGRAFLYGFHHPAAWHQLSLFDPLARGLFWHTLQLCGATALACLLCGTPIGFALARAPRVWQYPALFFTALPVALPPVIAAGPFVSLTGVTEHPLFFSCLALTTCFFPLVAFAVWAAVGAVPGEEEDAALLLSGELRAWCGPLLARLRPALLGSTALVAAFSAWEMAAPAFLEWPSYSMHVYRSLNDASVFVGHEKSYLATIASLPIIAVGALLLPGLLPAVRLLDGSSHAVPRTSRLGSRMAVLATGLLILVPGWLLWTFGRRLGSLNDSRDAITSNWSALLNTLICSLSASTLALGLALLLTTLWRPLGRSRRWLLVACLLPILFSPIILGISLIELFNNDLLGGFYDSRYGMLIYGMTARYLPVALALLWVAGNQVDEETLWASANLGAGALRTTWSVLIPLLRNALLGGFALLFALCAGELTITVLVEQPEGETLILPIFNFLHAGLESEVCFLCLLLLALTGGSMTLAVLLLRRRK